MKAINILESKHLEWSEIDLPLISDDEVLIKISATSVNRADVVQKNGLYPPPPGASNILGLECSGIIEKIGKNVKNRKVLCIGDNLNTDIKGANIQNFDSLLVGGGIHRNEISDKKIENLMKSHEVKIDYIQTQLKW